MKLSRIDFKTISAKVKDRKARRRANSAYIASSNRLAGTGGPKARRSLTMSQLEEKLWDIFSYYIRGRDIKRFGGKCWCGCGGIITDAGHVISRTKRGTKYNEDNVIGQAKKCNWMDKFVPGYHDKLVAIFINKFGAEKYLELVNLANPKDGEGRPVPVKHSRADRLTMIDVFKAKLEGIK